MAGETLDKTTLSGSAEIGFTREFSVQGDLSFSKFGATDFDSSNIALHSIFHAGSATSFGAYVGREHAEGDNLDYYGLEAGHSVGQFGGEIYVSNAKEDGVNGNLYGISGSYAINEQFSLNANYDKLDIEDLDAHRVQVGFEYRVDESFSFNGHFGQAEIEDLGSNDYVGIGAKFAFGPQKRTTFEQRNLLRVIPGL